MPVVMPVNGIVVGSHSRHVPLSFLILFLQKVDDPSPPSANKNIERQYTVQVPIWQNKYKVMHVVTFKIA